MNYFMGVIDMAQRSIEWGEGDRKRGETGVQIFSESCTFQRVAIEIWFPSTLLPSLWSPQGSCVQRLQVTSCHFWSASLLLECCCEATCLPRLPSSMSAPPLLFTLGSRSHSNGSSCNQVSSLQKNTVSVYYNNPIFRDLQYTWVFMSAHMLLMGQRILLLSLFSFPPVLFLELWRFTPHFYVNQSIPVAIQVTLHLSVTECRWTLRQNQAWISGICSVMMLISHWSEARNTL